MFKCLHFFLFFLLINAPSSESFVISVLGKGDIFDELVEMAKTKKISGKKIVIASYVNAVDITSSDMVFITYKSSNQLSAILDRMKGAPTIVITERPGLGEKGAGINFLNRGGKLTYELNKTMIKKSGMNTFGILNQLAIVTF